MRRREGGDDDDEDDDDDDDDDTLSLSADPRFTAENFAQRHYGRERRCGQHLDARLGAAVWGGGFPLSQVQSCEKGSEVSRNLDTFSSRYVKKRRVVRFFYPPKFAELNLVPNRLSHSSLSERGKA